jgi:hypothetical protein
MKFDFWFELPKSLTDLAQNEISKEELSLTLMIENSSKVTNFIK